MEIEKADANITKDFFLKKKNPLALAYRKLVAIFSPVSRVGLLISGRTLRTIKKDPQFYLPRMRHEAE